jgi:hypothetical protein
MAPVPLSVVIRDHGDPDLVCYSPGFIDYFTFFATNYFAHAFTLVSQPGQTKLEALIDALNALFIPGSGTLRAIRIIRLNSTFDRSNSLRQAASAGALCTVVPRSLLRTVQKSLGFTRWWTVKTIPEEIPQDRHIFGTCRIPQGYCLMQIHPQVLLDPYRPERSPSPADDTLSSTVQSTNPMRPGGKRWTTIKVPSSDEILKVIVSTLQAIWSINTLYQTRGDQIDLYGYGAFGLTVLPYAIMSLVNLITNLARPGYPCLYLVHTRYMAEAKSIPGAKFRGMIASVNESEIRKNYTFEGNSVQTILWYLGYTIISILPLATVGALTGFRTGNDIQTQRAWILAWLIIGSSSSLLVRTDRILTERTHTSKLELPLRLIIVSPLWIPAIGGMVQVWRMLRNYGICVQVH